MKECQRVVFLQMNYSRASKRRRLSATVRLMIFPRCCALFLATRIPQRLIRREPGKPVKKASYERSKNAWRTCDLPMPQGTTRTQPASPSFLCPLSLPSPGHLLLLPFFLHFFHRGTFPRLPVSAHCPLCGLRIKAPWIYVSSGLYKWTRTPFPVSGAWRCTPSSRWCHLPLMEKKKTNAECTGRRSA